MHAEIFGQPLLPRSRLILFLRERWKALTRTTPSIQAQLEAAPNPAKTTATGRGPWPSRTERSYSDAYLDRVHDKLAALDTRRRARFATHEAIVHESLIAMRDLLAERGILFVVVVHPDQVQIDPHLRDALVARRQMRRHLYDWTRPQRLVAEWCDEAAIECHDWQRSFQRAFYTDMPIYLPSDSHWDVEGNRLAAKLLEEILAPHVIGASIADLDPTSISEDAQ